MFILVFSLLFAQQVVWAQTTTPNVLDFNTFHQQLQAVYDPCPVPGTRSALLNKDAPSDDSLAQLFKSQQKREMLLKVETQYRQALDAHAVCDGKVSNPELSNEWLIVALTEVDIYNLGLDDKSVSRALSAARQALRCDLKNQEARRLARELSAGS